MALLSRLRVLVARLIALLIFRGPVLLELGGRTFWLDPDSGRLLPGVSGGAGDDDDSDDDDDDESEDEDDDDEDDDDDESEDEEKGKKKPGSKGKKKGKGKGSDDEDDDEDDDEEDEQKKPAFLRRAARKHERRAKREKRRADRLQKQVDKLKGKDGGKGKESDDEEDDDSEAKAELQRKEQELEEERRSFRLEQSVNRLARKGIEIEGDDGKQKVKFADPDDALVHVERMLRKGELDADDIFDSNGKVNVDGLTEALEDLAADKPQLVAKTKTKAKGGSGAGKGSGSGKSEEDLTVEERFKRLNKTS